MRCRASALSVRDMDRTGKVRTTGFKDSRVRVKKTATIKNLLIVFVIPAWPVSFRCKEGFLTSRNDRYNALCMNW